MQKNLWKSAYTGVVYELDTNILPKFGGWDLVGTITIDEEEREVKTDETVCV